MEDPDRPGDHACPHTLVTSIPDGIHKHKHTHNVNRWIEAKQSPSTRVPANSLIRKPTCCAVQGPQRRTSDDLHSAIDQFCQIRCFPVDQEDRCRTRNS